MFPWILCCILLIVVFFLITKIIFIEKSIDEIHTEFQERLSSDTNTLIDISSSDPHLRKLASEINIQLRLLRKERHRYQQGDLELKEAITNISHDLRTPLTAINGYLDLLEREEKSETVHCYLSQIQNRTDVLKNLTEEYFGEIEREEDLIDIHDLNVEIVSFTDNNGKKHRRGYKPKDRYTLKELLKRIIEVRGDGGDFNDIDTSDIESMESLFNDNKTFNGDITGWNVSSVRDMNNMFYNAISFNQPIGKWKFPKVENMKYMFYGATSFNQPIGDWEFPKVTDMSGMFYDAKSFNQPIGDWKFPNVTDMSSMFMEATSFNRPIGNWKFPNVENMNSMFWDALSFNQDISKWKFPNVENMSGMFSGASSFNQPIGDWEFPNVTDMRNMFSNATSFNQDLSKWDLKGKKKTKIFYGCPIKKEYKPKMK